MMRRKNNTSIDQKINDESNIIKTEKNEINKINTENNDFKIKIEEKQDNFIQYIQSERDGHVNEAKKIQNNIMEQCDKIKKENKIMNNSIDEIKNTFFHNLNEIEQYFNKKYQIIYRAMNLQEN